MWYYRSAEAHLWESYKRGPRVDFEAEGGGRGIPRWTVFAGSRVWNAGSASTEPLKVVCGPQLIGDKKKICIGSIALGTS